MQVVYNHHQRVRLTFISDVWINEKIQVTLTPPKIHMEPKNWWFVNVSFSKGVFSGSMSVFGGVGFFPLHCKAVYFSCFQGSPKRWYRLGWLRLVVSWTAMCETLSFKRQPVVSHVIYPVILGELMSQGWFIFLLNEELKNSRILKITG